MFIYNYDEKTKEYLGYEIAESDPEETKKQGKFIPLVPANATLEKVPPFHAENQTAVWEENIWKIVPDYRKNFLKVDNDLNVYKITTFGVQTGYIIVDKATGEDIELNKDWYKIVDNKVVKKSKEEYEKEQEEKEKERVANLTCTKRVFVLLLEELGLDYFEQIEPLINANRQAKLEWELCERLERKNPLLNQIGAELKITPEQLDVLFKFANGEVESLV